MVPTIENLTISLSNANTLSSLQRREILKEIRKVALDAYKPLSERCSIIGLDWAIIGMVDAALSNYAYFHNKNDQLINVAILKRRCIESAELDYEINNWSEEIAGQARHLFINYNDQDSKRLLMIVKQVFSKIEDICAYYSDHNFRFNIHKPLFDKCIENLEIEYNSESFKIRSEMLKVNGLKKEICNHKYIISIYYSDEIPKTDYDIKIIQSNLKLIDQFQSINDLNVYLFEKLIYYIFKKQQLDFEVSEFLDYHSANSVLPRKKFKKLLARVFKGKLKNLHDRDSTKVDERVKEMTDWLGLTNKSSKAFSKIVKEMVEDTEEMFKRLNEHYLENYDTPRPDNTKSVSSFNPNYLQILKQHYDNYSFDFIHHYKSKKLNEYVEVFFQNSWIDFHLNRRQWDDLLKVYLGGLTNELLARFLVDAITELDEFYRKVKSDIDVLKLKFNKEEKSVDQFYAYEFFLLHKSRVEEALDFLKSYQKRHGIQIQNISLVEHKNDSPNSIAILPEKKVAAKFYAFLQHLKIRLDIEKPFNMFDEHRMDRKQIENYAIEKYGFKDGQSFYREFIELDLTNKKDIPNKFGLNYKQKIIKLSNNDETIINELKKYPS